MSVVQPALAQENRSITISGVSSFSLIEPLIPQFEEMTGIDVDLQVLPYPQVRQRSMADFVSGTANSDIYGQDIVWLGEWAEKGYVVQLDDLIKRDLTQEDLDDILPGALDALSKWKGKTWSMPFGAYYFLMYYRQDLFDAAGLKAPVTLDDVDAAAAKLTDPATNMFGVSMPYQRGAPIASWFLATYTGAGGKLLKNPPENFAPTLDSPEALEVLTHYVDWLKYAPAGAIGHHWNDQTVAMQTGRIAMTPSFSINGTEFAKPERSVVAGKVGYTTMPRLSAEQEPVIPFGGWAVAINAKSEKVEDSWTFIKWLTSQDVQKQLALINGTPVRYSALEEPEVQKLYPWVSEIVAAEKEGQVFSDYRPRYPFYPQVEEILGLQLNRAALGEVTPAEALKIANEEITKVIKDAGHPVE
ncbi:extracellular solute-binding protein [Hoeflea sp. G2-23]|uniref:Extracellular solute-binding protein n=2 Tax=Hoeflea algicola TaxID=2983763 RepID=A0ABT3ZA13_9HYPH|nr:extracellular solute-binding protein [Hoeflea algicola]